MSNKDDSGKREIYFEELRLEHERELYENRLEIKEKAQIIEVLEDIRQLLMHETGYTNSSCVDEYIRDLSDVIRKIKDSNMS